MTIRVSPSLSSVERALNDLDENYRRLQMIRRKLRTVRAGTEAQLYTLDELARELDWLRLEADLAEHLLEQFEESLPEDQ